uniref:Rap associating with DIL domain n=1 Tax=Latimeria chalumnae TaxID=7897 RepID=H3AEL1_LATCH
GINAQARKLQRNRAKGAITFVSSNHRGSGSSSLRRTLSETSLHHLGSVQGSSREREEKGGSIKRSLYQSPHLLLLQGYSQQSDCLVYLLNREQHIAGRETPSTKPNITLSAPDTLPLHCKIRKVKLLNKYTRNREEKLVLETAPGAHVSVNFSKVERATLLHHGDLLSFGAQYIFLFKDPMCGKVLPSQTLFNLKNLGQALGSEAMRKEQATPTCITTPRRKLQLEYEQAFEDTLLDKILTLIEPGGDDCKLTPAFLLCLCIQHSATSFESGEFGKILLKIVKRIQSIVWDKTKELAEKQAQHQDQESLSHLSITDLIPDLQHILFWMSNSIELLYFIQQKTPEYIQGIEDIDIQGSKESLLSSTISANEEAMTVLEEVIMYTFQQCVYYITKSLYVALPALLESNPFLIDNNDSCQQTPPEPVRRVQLIYQIALDLLQQYEVHPEIASQMFAYLFFFSNVSLFNQLMDKGPWQGCFLSSRGEQMKAAFQLLFDWVQNVELGPLAEEFFQKLSSAMNLIAMPASQLLQMSWWLLRLEFPALNPAQLHHILSHYQPKPDTKPIVAWQPDPGEETAAYRTEDILESFDNHPPIVLPSTNFQVNLETDTLDDTIYRHLLYVRHFLWSLGAKPQSNNGCSDSSCPQGIYNTYLFNRLFLPAVLLFFDSTAPSGTTLSPETLILVQMTPVHQSKPSNLQSAVNVKARTVSLPVDPSCLLTPPNTPLNSELSHVDSVQVNGYSKAPEYWNNETNCLTTDKKEGNSPDPIDFPTPISSSRSSAMDDFCYVFAMELEKGPFGLGMGLIDGLHTPLNSPGIYIRTLIPDGPAASDGRLFIGDRILAVNGTSLVGADYQR